MPNLVLLGAGVWMAAHGIPGIQSLSGALMVVGGVIVIIASFIAG